jgi:type IX secretion system PorP/SprF family membrane protein
MVMLKKTLFIYMVLIMLSAKSQEPELPYDFRQHNLTEYNSSLLSPVFSLDRNNPQSVALWTRWQWQTIDGSPTTLFLNYSRKLNDQSGIGGGFLQHNTGVFVNTGGILNYAYNFILNPQTQLTVGVNAIGFQRKLADEYDVDFPQFEEKSNFILQIAPAVKLQLNAFSFGIAMENLVDRNMTSNEGNASATGLIYMGLASYDFPINIFGDSTASYIRPTLYYKRLPDFDNQVGFNTFFSTPKFWGQVGYNSFYGISTGIGGHFFEKVSLGALIEFGTGGDLKGENPSFEIVTAFSFGKQVFEIEEITAEELPEDKLAEEALLLEAEKQRKKEESELVEAQRKQDSLAAVRTAEILALEQQQNQKTRDSIAAVNQQNELAKAREQAERKRIDSVRIAREAVAIAVLKEQEEKRKADSLNAAKQAEALAEVRKEKEKAQQDSINKALEKAKLAEVAIEPEKGEKYEETATEDGLEPGFYLIANVFGTKTYYTAFMKKLSDEGLEPKSFYRSKNKYNYVYLNRYETMEEARKARDSKFGGRYTEKTWIFRVIGE